MINEKPNSRLKTINKQTFENQQNDRNDVENDISNILINELFNSKILNDLIIKSEFKDFKARSKKRRKRIFFNLSAFDN